MTAALLALALVATAGHVSHHRPTPAPVRHHTPTHLSTPRPKPVSVRWQIVDATGFLARVPGTVSFPTQAACQAAIWHYRRDSALQTSRLSCVRKTD